MITMKELGIIIPMHEFGKENIELVLSEWNDFMNHKGEDDRKEMNDLIKEINCELNKMKDDNV